MGKLKKHSLVFRVSRVSVLGEQHSVLKCVSRALCPLVTCYSISIHLKNLVLS